MIINDNLQALNTFNALTQNTNAMNQALEELSTGKRINTAADNPAGWTISEAMQGQISGLNQANNNAQDGISMLQTAMGGMTQQQNIMETMRSLAVQAANGTNTSSDLAAIQAQVNQLTSEITQIGQTTQYNTMNILEGGTATATMSTLTTSTGGSAGAAGIETLTIMTSLGTGTTITISGGSGNMILTAGLWSGLGLTISQQAAVLAAAITAGTGLVATAAGNVVTLTQAATSLTAVNPSGVLTVGTGGFIEQMSTQGAPSVTGAFLMTVTTNFAAGDEAIINGQAFTAVSSGASTNQFVIGATITASMANLALAINANAALGFTGFASGGNGAILTLTQQFGYYSSYSPSVTIGAAFTTNLQVGPNQNQFMAMSLNDTRASAVGLAGTTPSAIGAQGNVTGATFTNGVGANQLANYTVFGEGALNVSTVTGATAAVSVINEAVNSVSVQNSMLGAYVDRMQTSESELSATATNLTSANALLTDVDMDSEMTAYTQNSILVQSATSMLAQAQQAPQSVLKLLG